MSRKSSPRRKNKPRPRALRVESLEDRRLMAGNLGFTATSFLGSEMFGVDGELTFEATSAGAAFDAVITFADDTANGNDYQSTPVVVHFPDYAATDVITMSFSVSVSDDVFLEGTEQFQATISDAVDPLQGTSDSTININSAASQAAMQIEDNESATLRFVPSIDSTDESNSSYSFDVQILITAVVGTAPTAGVLANDLQVNFSSPDTPGIGVDFSLPASLTFSAGTAGNESQTVSVSINDDLIAEGDETFTIQMTEAVDNDAVTIVGDLQLTIVDNDFAPTASPFSPLTVSEDDADSTLDLSTFFDDADDGVAGLTFSVFDNDATSLVTTSIAGSQLTLSFVADEFGSAMITVRATDPGGNFVDNVLDLTVLSVNDAPSFTLAGDFTAKNNSNSESISGFASSISTGPVNESDQSKTFTLSTNNDALFSVLPEIDSAGTLTFTTVPGMNGTATVTVLLMDDGGTANSGQDTSTPQTFTINHFSPTASAIPETIVNEDAASSTLDVSSFFSDVDNGSVALTISLVSNSDTTLLTASLSGTVLTTDFLADQNGAATIVVRATDLNGNTVDNTLTVTVNPVNDQPSFTVGSNIVITNDGTAQKQVGFATAISAGPANESGQSLSFTLTTNNDALFASLPTINRNNGNLLFTPAAGASGVARIQVVLTDDGGTTNGGVDTSTTQTFRIRLKPTRRLPPAAAIRGDSLGVPGQELSFRLIARDRNATTQAGTQYTFNVNWQDGTTETFEGPSGLVVTHAFPAAARFKPTVTATDQAGLVSPTARTGVAIRSAVLDPDMTIFIGGGIIKDTIVLRPVNLDGYVRTFLNGRSLGVAQLCKIVIYGNAGNDMIIMQTRQVGFTTLRLNAPAFVFGGDGDDLIDGSANFQRNVFFGENGDDTLIGGMARDRLDGGSGNNVIRNQAGQTPPPVHSQTAVTGNQSTIQTTAVDQVLTDSALNGLLAAVATKKKDAWEVD